MKTFIITAVLFIVAHFGAKAQLEMYGSIGYTIHEYDNTVTLRVETIENNSDGGRSGSLQLVLLFSKSNNFSSDIKGYTAAKYDFSSTLRGGYLFSDVEHTVDFTPPPSGSYYPSILLLEWNGSSYEYVDYFTFSEKEYFD